MKQNHAKKPGKRPPWGDRPRRSAGSTNFPVMRWLLGLILVFVIVAGHDRWRATKARESAARVAAEVRSLAPRSTPESPTADDADSSPYSVPPAPPPARQGLAVLAPPATPSMELPSPAEEEKPDTTVSFVMELNRSNNFMGQGSINGKQVTLLADTGASHVVVPEKIAQSIGLKKGQAMAFKTGGGTVPHYATTLDTLILGRIEMRNVPAAINPAMQEDFVLLGMSALALMDMQLDQGKLVLKYKPAESTAVAGDSARTVEPFRRSIKDCARKGNQFDRATLDCLKGN